MLPAREVAEPLERLGVVAFTTTRAAGTFGTNGSDPVSEVMARWEGMRRSLPSGTMRLATASQVHGARVLTHGAGWSGWLRGDAADGHVSREAGTALAVTIADCVPVFLAHPSGTAGVLHAGWRGVVAGVLERGVRALEAIDAPADELVAHLGPAICGTCYEVSPDVYRSITGREVERATTVDLREVLEVQARELGITEVSRSASCTRCRAEFFSHRGGDAGRQIAVVVVPG